MKKEFNIKLTVFLVSLFIGLGLIIFGNKISYCLGFGLILLGISLIVYAYYKAEVVEKTLILMQEDMDENPEQDQEVLKYQYKQLNKVNKQKGKTWFLFGFVGVVLIVIGFACLI